MPLISIVVPVCNVENYVGECLESLRLQTLKDIEFICVDDGSTDRSLRVIQRFAALDNRFKVITGKNAGYGAACNKGLTVCEGKYIGILESDDFCDSTFYEDLTAIAEEYNCDVVKSDFYRYWNSGRYLSFKNFDDILYDVVFEPKRVLGRHNLFEAQSCIWSAIYRRDMLNRNNIRFLETPGASYQDLSFSVKVFMSAERMYLTKRAYVYYRQSESQSIKSLGKPWFAFEEYAELEKLYPMTPELFASKYHNYMWNYNRVGIEHKYKFIERFSKEFKKHLIDNERIVNERLFHPWEPGHLKIIVNSPLTYHDMRIREIYDREGWRVIPAEKPEFTSEPPEKIFISIIVPCYNVEWWLLSCLESLLNQKDADDIEIICVDDCSTDRTLDILEYTAKRDARIRVIKHDVNGGLAAARNTGISAARGEFLMFVDSDDMIEVNAVSILRSKLKQRPDANIINYSATAFPEERNTDWLKGRFHKYGNYIEKSNVYHFFTRKEFTPFVWMNLVRRNWLGESGIVFNEDMRFGEDTIWLREVFSIACNILIIPEHLYRYRQREGSLMSQFSADNQLNILRTMFTSMGHFIMTPIIVHWAMDFVYKAIIDSPIHIKQFCDMLWEYGYTYKMDLHEHYRNVMENEFNRRIREAGL